MPDILAREKEDHSRQVLVKQIEHQIWRRNHCDLSQQTNSIPNWVCCLFFLGGGMLFVVAIPVLELPFTFSALL
jgi:hypothetical protein